jgi:hypothetical protein
MLLHCLHDIGDAENSVHDYFNITLWNKLLFDVAPLFKKFPVVHGTRKFVTVFTELRHRVLFRTNSHQFTSS